MLNSGHFSQISTLKLPLKKNTHHIKLHACLHIRKKHMHIIFSCQTVFPLAAWWQIKHHLSLYVCCMTFQKKKTTSWKMNRQSPLSNLADINFESNRSPLRWKCSHTANTAEKSSTPGLQPSAAFSSLFWFTGPSGWGPAALTGPGIKSHGQLPAHELRQAAYYTCA